MLRSRALSMMNFNNDKIVDKSEAYYVASFPASAVFIILYIVPTESKTPQIASRSGIILE